MHNRTYNDVKAYLIQNCNCQSYKEMPRPYQLEDDVAEIFISQGGLYFSLPENDLENGYFSNTFFEEILVQNGLEPKPSAVKKSEI